MNQNAGLDRAELEKISDEIVSYIATPKGAPRWAVSVSVTSLDSNVNTISVWEGIPSQADRDMDSRLLVFLIFLIFLV
ncbi:hypothetical protein B9Q08_02225 [Candidatus Marsarchaeota G2 archaeon ECH_B_SAG-M15]|uniref:Uncharacterized protein n=1 Tax=Candidatus Marsarchaeota G2 archaeon ECH_B_SAG-M15 TaxID=1978162 RepID=A0A2R6AZJ4_9ARCH|nr:MAG: hypothetical protein B9Q08_02225 [Candidatus Marsarchaeota G2 archaeon ECH_B_SAG-M15]